MKSNRVCLQRCYSRSGGAGCGRPLRQSASLLPRASDREAVAAARLANQRAPSSALEEVSSEQPVRSAATMDAIPCLLFVLLFWTRIQENAGKCPRMDGEDLCLVFTACLSKITISCPATLARKALCSRSPKKQSVPN